MSTYRFHIDLRKVDAFGEDKAASPPQDSMAEIDPEWLHVRAQESAIQTLEPARVDPSHWSDSREAEDLLQVYNASLRRAQQMEMGTYRVGNLDYNVFFDEWDNKHVVMRPFQNPQSRVSELVVSPGGIILRFAYEHAGGAPDSTNDLFRTGVSRIEEDPERLYRARGYVLRTTRLERTGPYLVGFQQKTQFYDESEGRVRTQNIV